MLRVRRGYGAIIGDIIGSRFEFNNYRNKNFKLFHPDCFFTDDSVMTAAVDYWCNHQDEDISHILRVYGRAYPRRGYGGQFSLWLRDERIGSYWSYGNGAAMRVSPVAWYAKSEEECKYLARRVTEVTHNHPEGLKGAEVTAMMVYKAKNGASKEVLRDYAINSYPEIKNFSYEELRANYIFNETCRDTVPQALYCFLISESFEDCIRIAISIGGDSDTLAAIAGSIAEAYYSIPKWMINKANKYLRRV